MRGWGEGSGFDAATGERAEDPLVCLAGEGPRAGLAERGAWPGGGSVEEVVEAVAGEHQQAVGDPGAGDGEAAEGGVELIELPGAGEQVDGDRDAVCLALPGVDG